MNNEPFPMRLKVQTEQAAPVRPAPIITIPNVPVTRVTIKVRGPIAGNVVIVRRGRCQDSRPLQRAYHEGAWS